MPWSGRADDSVQIAQELLARAQAGDQAAAQQLHAAASAGGWRPDHRVAAQEAWNALTPGTEGDLALMKNPHGPLGDVGKAIGGGLKFLAPFAGLIPGIGPLAGGALAAGGSALGGVLHGDKFNLLDTALAGGAGYLGGKMNPFGGGAPAMPAASGLGNATQGMAGQAPGILGQVGNAGVGSIPGLMDPSTGGGGFLERLGLGGGSFLDKALQYGPLVAGGIAGAHRTHEADQLTQQGLAGIKSEYDARAPLRAYAQSGILGLQGLQRPDLSAVFADPNNRWGRN